METEIRIKLGIGIGIKMGISLAIDVGVLLENSQDPPEDPYIHPYLHPYLYPYLHPNLYLYPCHYLYPALSYPYLSIPDPFFKPEGCTGSTRIHRIHQDPPGGSADPPPKPYVYRCLVALGDF